VDAQLVQQAPDELALRGDEHFHRPDEGLGSAKKVPVNGWPSGCARALTPIQLSTAMPSKMSERVMFKSVVANTRRLLRPVRRLWNEASKRIFGHPNDFLAKCRGVIHVGANTGQERDEYAENRLAVIWIEPIPEVHRKLAENVRSYPKQVAIQALITDKDGTDHVLHVADNEGASSSILEFEKHRDIWPDVHYTHDLKITSQNPSQRNQERRS
jgi:hypothetical protein